MKGLYKIISVFIKFLVSNGEKFPFLFFPFPFSPLPQHAVLGADNWLGDGSSREKGADWMAKADWETGSS
jgi:hypothetical protein